MNIKILWADDEIDLLKPHILFLEEKGYAIMTANNGDDALELFENDKPDIVFLDENMPGLSGLETLSRIKEKNASVPVIMITKSEEESIMEEAIGSKISDYLIKPVNPMQILLSIKKNLDEDRLVSEKTTASYQVAFRDIGMKLNDRMDAEEWAAFYQRMIYWELELERSDDEGMREVFNMQKSEANQLFAKFVESNYRDWVNGGEDAPIMSHTLFKERVAPEIKAGDSLFFIVIDNLRWDQWKIIRGELEKLFRMEEEAYYSILPTATQYARNAIFSGATPLTMSKTYSDWWKNDQDEGGKNQFEAEFLNAQLRRLGLDVSSSYNKVTNLKFGKKLNEQFNNLLKNDLNVIVYNFVDMLSHARTDMEVIRELADDESAYRSLTASWFEHSPLLEIIRKVAASGKRIVLTTDHGTARVTNPVKVVGDRNTTTNLRYKQGKNLSYKSSEVFEIKNPEEAQLPRVNVSSSYIFGRSDDFFAYPNNYNYYVNYYRDTFQHGGLSLEEMVIPIVKMNPK